MSKIGKKPIEIPKGVEVNINNNIIKVKGPKGELSLKLSPRINVEKNDEKIIVSKKGDAKELKMMWGTTNVLIANMIKGVSSGFEKRLEIHGVGYRANVLGKDLSLTLGFSHPVVFKAPEKIEFRVEKNEIIISGIDKEKIGQIAAKIRDLRKPEPYKGKGIRYKGEIVRRKSGKAVQAAEGASK